MFGMTFGDVLRSKQRPMRDYVTIGSAPADEVPAQVGSENYASKALVECKVYIEQLKRELGDPPLGAQLKTKAFPHDYGTYHEVVCFYDDHEGRAYALRCESEGPLLWDNISQQRLAHLFAEDLGHIED